MVSTVLIMLILTLSGCITINLNAPTPTPVAAQTSTTTPRPTSTPLAVDNIVGIWEGSKNSNSYSIQFSGDGTLIYNDGGNLAKGAWVKINERQYKISILSSDTVITLDDNMIQFNWGPKGVIFTKKT